MLAKQTPLRALIPAALLLQSATAVVRTATPQLGWNSYNYYSCFPNETIIKENAQGLVDLGFAEKGYNIVTTDCGWSSTNRTADGKITWNETFFPSGFPALGEYIHGLGLQFGLYSGAGKWQCTTDSSKYFLVASLGYEESDAQTFAEWGGDALKYDNCWANVTEGFVVYDPYEPDPSVRFAKMSQALDAVDRPILYQICQWGVGEDLGEWAPRWGNSWRISNDIYNSWSSIWRITNQVVPYWKHTGVGKYADMDMLIIGLNALSLEEERFHFTMWAINKSPLTVGAPMSTTLAPKASLDIMLNAEALAINQDALGEQARLIRRYTEEEYDIWAGNLTSSRLVVAVPNWRNASQTVTLNLTSALGIASAGAVRDVWAGADLDPIDGDGSITLALAAHEAKLLVLSDITPSTTSLVQTAYAPVTSATLAGGASLSSCGADQCLPVGAKAVNLYPGATATFANLSSPSSSGGTALLLGIDYINYDVALQSAWSTGTNTRNLTVSVNGGPAKRWALPISGGDWFETGRLDVEVEGFVAGAENVVVVGAPGPDPAPDLVGLAVLEVRGA